MTHSTEAAHAADPLAALRAATASRHELLDSSLPIGAPDASLRDYAAHLALLRAWLAPLQAWSTGYSDGPQGVPGFDNAARLALIDADLAEPGMPAAPDMPVADMPVADVPVADMPVADMPVADVPVADMPASGDWPDGASAAWRWGVAYVVEGSQLGGAVLHARLRERLAPHPLRYLRGQADGPGPRWRAFMQALRAHVRTPAEIAEACAGACAAFDRILALRAARR